jgi:hypothetical protein
MGGLKMPWALLQRWEASPLRYSSTLLVQHSDSFELGRHPATGLFRARDLSFGYEILFNPGGTEGETTVRRQQKLLAGRR